MIKPKRPYKQITRSRAVQEVPASIAIYGGVFEELLAMNLSVALMQGVRSMTFNGVESRNRRQK